ncbi:MAG: amino acid permease [Actinomycetota bacterium]|nr:amino acid permease [Actinomycetota bacterium]
MATGETVKEYHDDDDERALAEMGYKQELNRSWSAFSNFAISFTIISVLAGCFTTYGQAWNNGGPVAISWGWPLISIPILIVGFSMSEIVAKYPTAGGIYWWSARLGGPVWGWFTGWFNLIGLVAVVASVMYACAGFINVLLGLYEVDFILNFADGNDILQEQFVLFALILILSSILNIFRTHLLALINNVSVFWHVAGVAVIIAILVFVPDDHQSFDFVFTERFNNSGFGDGSTGSIFFWLYVLPLGFLLTQYTITGFDASAHISEETIGASKSAARGVWQSIFYSAVIGWFVLLAITFAATDVNAINDAAGYSPSIFTSALDTWAAKLVIMISAIGQLFCGTACLTSASRMCFAFSRDRGIPGSRVLSKVNPRGVPVAAVLAMALAALTITLPALIGDEGVPYAFFAVVSISVIGLYIAYVIPIYLRWRTGSAFEQSPAWNLGNKWRWMNPFAVVWVAIITVIFSLPISPLAVPWNGEGGGDGKFDLKALNYAPVTVLVIIVVVGIWWKVSAHKYFTGQTRNVDIDQALEGKDPPEGSGPGDGPGTEPEAGSGPAPTRA